MPKLRVHSFAISLDGYGAGPDQDLDNPLGVGGEALHEWVFATRTFQTDVRTGRRTTGVDDDFAARGFANIGAWIIGRNMFGPVRGRGPTTAGRGGGATTRRTTCPSSCSPTTRGRRSRWRAAPRSTSSPMASTPR